MPPSKSKSQQQLMGMVHAVQTGKMKPPKSGKVASIAKKMKPSDVEKFAKTKTKGLPKHVSKSKKEYLKLNIYDRGDLLKEKIITKTLNQLIDEQNNDINSQIKLLSDKIKEKSEEKKNTKDKNRIYDIDTEINNLHDQIIKLRKSKTNEK